MFVSRRKSLSRETQRVGVTSGRILLRGFQNDSGRECNSRPSLLSMLSLAAAELPEQVHLLGARIVSGAELVEVNSTGNP